MKTFCCNNCGHRLQRPTQPYKCPHCGKQAVGLFKPVPNGGQPAPPAAAPPSPVTPPVTPGAAPVQQGASPIRPGVPPTQPGITPQAASPLPQPPTPPAALQPAPPSPQPPAQTSPPQAAPPAQPPPPEPPPPEPPPTDLKASLPQVAPPQPPAPPAEKTRREKQAAPPEKRRLVVAAKPKAPASSPPKSTAAAKTPRGEPSKPTPPKPKRPEQFAWAFPEEPPPQRESKALTNAPAVDSTGRIYVHLQGRLVALEVQEDRPKVCWEYVTSSHAPGPVGVAADGTLRLHCSDGMLHCLSFEGKQIYPPVGVGEPLGYASPMADRDGNTWISAFDGGLIKVDAEGRPQKRGRYFRSRQKFDAPGVIHDGVLYIGSEEGCVFAIRLGDKKGTNLWDHAVGQGSTGWYVHSSPAITADGAVVVAGRDEHLYGFAAGGKPLWRTVMPGQMLASPAIDRHGHIYVGISQSRRGEEPRGTLACIDGNSHKIRWQYKAAGPVESTPVIGDDDVLYFGDNTGTIHAVDFRGAAVWTAKVESPVRSAGTILASQRVAFGLDNETLLVLKCSSKGLAEAGWPKMGRTLGQCGMV